LTDDVADYASRLLVRLVVVVAELAHRVQHAAVHRLQPVPHVRQRAAHDHAHRVIEVGLPHLVLEIDRQYFLRPFSHSFRSKNNALISVDAGQGERDMLRDMVSPAERHGGPTGRDSSAQKTTQILTQRLAIRRLTADSRGYTC